VKIWLSLCLVGCVRFARHCGKMYRRHLVPHGGFASLFPNLNRPRPFLFEIVFDCVCFIPKRNYLITNL